MTIKDDEVFRAMQPRFADLLPRLNEWARRVPQRRQSVSTVLRGSTAATLTIDGVAQRVLVRAGTAPADLAALRVLPLPTARGTVALSDVATVTQSTIAPSISHTDGSRSVQITARPAAGDLGAVTTALAATLDGRNQYRRSGRPLLDAVIEGSAQRLRPILMTAVATVCALLPMALGLTGGGVFISQPLAIVVIGGLISSTLLTLVLVPVLYTLTERAHERRWRLHRARGARAGAHRA